MDRSASRVPGGCSPSNNLPFIQDNSSREDVARVSFLNEEEAQQQSGNNQATTLDTTTAYSDRGSIVGNKHLLSDGESKDEFDGNSKKRKSAGNHHMESNSKATAHIDPLPSTNKKATSCKSAVHQPRKHSFEEEGLKVVEEETSAVMSEEHNDTAEVVDCAPKSNDATAGRGTTEEKVLSILVGIYFTFTDRKKQAHLRHALRAVIIASAGSLTTIQFLSEISGVTDNCAFVVANAFRSESLTPTVARWIIDWTRQQANPSAKLASLLISFVIGSAPLAAGHLLLQHVDGNSTYLPRMDGEMAPVWFFCLKKSKAGVNDSRLLLVLRNVNLSWSDVRGWSALHYAAISNQLVITKYLVNERNMDVNEQDEKGFSALILAIWKGNAEVAKFLAFSPSSKLKLQNRYGHTALHCAALFNRLDVATLLVNELSVDTNQQDSWGCTSLMYAIARRHTEIAKLLALHPLARLGLQNNNGLDARHFAAVFHQREVSEILVNRRNETIDGETI